EIPGVAGGFWAGPDNLYLEMRPQERTQPWSVEPGESRDETVRRKDRQAGIAHAHQHHENEIGGVVVGEAASLTTFFQVTQGGFVTVVAVGNEDGLGAH